MLPVVQLDAKVCKICNTEKPLTEFHKAGKWVVRRCKSCAHSYYKKWRLGHKKELKARASEWYQKNKSMVLKRTRDWELKRNFGITIQEYNRLFQMQGGMCAICGIHQNSINKSLRVDHCHKRNLVRGLLCHNCNVGLGLIKESTEVLKKMIDYLEKSCSR